MNQPTLVIVGAGLAGDHAAIAARTAAYDGRIVLVGAEPEQPYERPPLSKAVVRGEARPDTAHVRALDDYATHGIELRTGQDVSGIDRANRRIRLGDGDQIPFTTAVLATGSEPRRLQLAGADLAGVHLLRTLPDAVTLRDALLEARRVVVVGAGWIGCEVAASARQVGCEVAVIDPGPTPLHRVLGATIGAVFRDLHREHGVDLRLGAGVDAILGDRTVEGVGLTDGSRVEADLVVAGIGVTPRTELAAAAGLAVDDGIVVDEHLRTSDPDIFAAGDVANAWHPHFQRRIRVEHWAIALNQGDTAGANAAGRSERYDRLPYFFSDQYDLGLEYVGHHDRGDTAHVMGDADARKFVAYWEGPDGKVTAAMAVNTWDVVEHLKTAVRNGTPPQL
jgi:3-phenylpropionate/trans-cinnamate dioxygenase ferredoxin reductase subunit